MKLIIATNNEHKVIEFERILTPLGHSAVSQRAEGLHIEAEENADTFEGNALIKARAVFEAAGLPTIADDSGLVVDALNGAPGVYSARYGGPGLDDIQRYEKVLEEMKNVPPERRTARFVSCIALVLESGKEYTFTGTCEGSIGFRPRGENGFGYDPIFLVGEKSFSELSGAEKDSVSHRGIALRKLSRFLQGLSEGDQV